MTNQGFIIAIDGPVAAGKSTIASKLASQLNAYYLYTGSMYRAVTLYCLKNNINITNQQQVIDALRHIKVKFENNQIYLNGKNVAQEIVTRDVEQAVSTISDYKDLRKFLRKQQQQIGKEKVKSGKIVIADGRDMGTVVFPEAILKIYLTAKPEIRSRRRFEQMKKRGVDISFDQVLKDTLARDENDMHGKLHYLVEKPKAHGYIVIDDSDQTQKQTISDILQLLRQKNLI